MHNILSYTTNLLVQRVGKKSTSRTFFFSTIAFSIFTYCPTYLLVFSILTHLILEII